MKKIACMVLVLLMVFSLVACQQADTNTGDTAADTDTSDTAADTGTSTDEGDADTTQEDVDTSGTVLELYPDSGITYGPIEGLTEDDYRFGFSFGGIAAYADPCPGMANKAAKELGIPEIVVQTPQNWDQNEQNEMLDALIASGMQGIFMMPSEATAGNEQITKMVDAGINIVCIGGPPDLPSKCTLTLATDVYNSAYTAAKTCIEAMGEEGNLVALSGDLNDTNTQKRLQGVRDAVDEYPNVTLFQEIADIENPEASVTAVGNLLAASGDEIDGIVATTYFTAVATAQYLMQDEYSDIKGVGTDTDEKVMEAIAAGAMVGTMAQNPWGQAYISIYTLKMLKDGWTYKGEEEVVDSGSILITKDGDVNVDNFEDYIIEFTNQLMSTWADRFNPPA